MEKKIINTDKAPAAVGPYVQAIQKGNMLYASGQLGLVPETGVLLSLIHIYSVKRSMQSFWIKEPFRELWVPFSYIPWRLKHGPFNMLRLMNLKRLWSR